MSFVRRVPVALAAPALAATVALVVACTSSHDAASCDYVVTRCNTVCDTWCDSWGCYPDCYDQCWNECGYYVRTPTPAVLPPDDAGEASAAQDGAAREPAPRHDAGPGVLCSACTSNDDCAAGSLCIVRGGGDASSPSGFCGSACASSSDCPQGFACASIGASRQCLPTSPSSCP